MSEKTANKAERPILFSAPMVRALLSGMKTQTRRALRNHPPPLTGQISTYHHPDPRPMFYAWVPTTDGGAEVSDWPPVPCPYGAPGDRLWVRETLAATRDANGYIVDWHYAADGTKVPRCPDLLPQFNDGMAFAHLLRKAVPSIFMPRWASRITLEITGVRVERLQDISEADAAAEGVTMEHQSRHWGPKQEYAHLWESINGGGSWDVNPWVWCVSFRRIEQP